MKKKTIQDVFKLKIWQFYHGKLNGRHGNIPGEELDSHRATREAQAHNQLPSSSNAPI